MKTAITAIFLFISSLIYSQPQYNSVFIELDSIDENNRIYKTGMAFIFDYEIVRGNDTLKLKYNNHVDNPFLSSKDIDSVQKYIDEKISNGENPFEYSFEYSNIYDDSIGIDKIIFLVYKTKERTNNNQTEILLLQSPDYSNISSTGLIENNVNVWLHPIRCGYFAALQACPFPYIKRKCKVGYTWKDAMRIGYGMSEHTGAWKGRVTLHYTYKIVDKKIIPTKLGNMETYVIESKAKSKYFTTYLTSYFSETYGFVRWEYTLVNGIKLNFWIDEIKKGVKCSDYPLIWGCVD
jgi:hypothetical protein